MAGAPQGGTTTNASSFSLNEDIKLPMGGRYQPTSSVGVFGGPQTRQHQTMHKALILLAGPPPHT